MLCGFCICRSNWSDVLRAQTVQFSWMRFYLYKTKSQQQSPEAALPNKSVGVTQQRGKPFQRCITLPTLPHVTPERFVFLPGIKLRMFHLLGECVNHYWSLSLLQSKNLTNKAVSNSSSPPTHQPCCSNNTNVCFPATFNLNLNLLSQWENIYCKLYITFINWQYSYSSKGSGVVSNSLKLNRKLTLSSPPRLSTQKVDLGSDVMPYASHLETKRKRATVIPVSLFLFLYLRFLHISFLSPLSHIYLWLYTSNNLSQTEVGFQTFNVFHGNMCI